MDQDIVVRILPLLPSYEEVLKSMIEYWQKFSRTGQTILYSSVTVSLSSFGMEKKINNYQVSRNLWCLLLNYYSRCLSSLGPLLLDVAGHLGCVG